MSALRIHALGPFRLWRGEELVADEGWPTHKSKTLFKILLTERGRFIPADRLIESLWPDLSLEKAQNNLWVTASQLRRVLQPDLPRRAPSEYILTSHEGYRFDAEGDYWLDVEAFTDQLSAARAGADAAARIEAFEAARKLYRGDYLEDDPYEEWALAARERLREDYLALLADLADAHARQGRYRRAIALCQESLAVEDARETVYRQLMLYHYCAGEQNLALKAYEACRRALSDELDVEPMPETTELYRQIQRRHVAEVDRDVAYPRPVETFPAPYSLSRTPFVGRGQEHGQLANLLGKMAAGQGQVALVEGEPGIGKSRLAQEMAGLAHEQGLRTLLAGCYEVELAVPYQPLIDLLHQALEGPPAETLRGLPAVALAEIAVLAPEVGAVVPGLPTLPAEFDQARQMRQFKALAQLFSAVAGERGLVLVVEDVHWADHASLQFFRHLGRHLADQPIMLLCTYRSEELATNTSLASFVAGLKREPHVLPLKLSRLSPEQVKSMLESMTLFSAQAAELSRWLHRETDGNPFFLVTILQSLLEQGALTMEGRLAEEEVSAQPLWAAVPGLALPDTLRESVRERLRRVPKELRQVLDAASVLGRQFDFAALESVTRQSRTALVDGVEGLLARQLLREAEGGRSYDFTHDKIREVVYHELSSARRTLLHQEVAAALEGLAGGRLEEMAAILAAHYREGQVWDKAIEYSRLAARRAEALYAYEEAIHHLRAALDLTEKQGELETRAATLEQLADAYRSFGQSSQSVPLYGEALAFWGASPGVEPMVPLRLHHKILRSAREVKWKAEFESFEAIAEAAASSRASLEIALRDMEGQAHVEVVRALTTLAEDARFVRVPPDLDAAERHAQAAADMARRLDLPLELSDALGALGLAYSAGGRLRERLQIAQRRLQLLDDPRLSYLRERAVILSEVGNALVWVGEYRQATPYLLEVENLCNQIRDVGLQVHVLLLQSLCWFALDRWDDLLQTDERRAALEGEYPREQLGATCFNIALCGAVHALQGDEKKAASLREEAHAIMVALGGPPEGWGRNQYY